MAMMNGPMPMTAVPPMARSPRGGNLGKYLHPKGGNPKLKSVPSAPKLPVMTSAQAPNPAVPPVAPQFGGGIGQALGLGAPPTMGPIPPSGNKRMGRGRR